MFTDVQLLQIKNAAMRALHVPGNYRGGILEMALAVDYHMDGGQLRTQCGQIAGALKRTDEIFRNVRLNLIKWVSDDEIIKEVSSLAALQLGRGFEDHEPERGHDGKSLDELLRQLKLFYARSKIIILITDGSYRRVDEEKIREHLQPFLGRKLVVVTSGRVSSGREWL